MTIIEQAVGAVNKYANSGADVRSEGSSWEFYNRETLCVADLGRRLLVSLAQLQLLR